MSEKGLSGNTMIIAQPTARYEQVMPDLVGVSERLVVLYCRSVADVRKAQVLMLEREPYKRCLELRRRVCPAFSSIVVCADAAEKLPESGVPQQFVEAAVCVPEISTIKTTMEGPASRISECSSRNHDESSDVDSEEDDVLNRGSGAGSPDGSTPQLAASSGDSNFPDQLSAVNQHEAIIG